MKPKSRFIWLSLCGYLFILLVIFDLNISFAGTYPGKWYGCFCPEMKEKDLVGLYKYDTRNNLDAIQIKPAFFSLEYLRSYFGGR